MIYAVIILSILLVMVIISFILYRRQISDFCRQLAFIKKTDTNKILTQSLSNKELTRLTNSLNELITQHKQAVIDTQNKDQRLKAAITNVSHDIRTPLTSLDGYFQLLVEATDDAERRHYCTIINERIASLSMLLEQLFTYTKLQNDSYNIELDKVNISNVLSNTVLSFYNDISAQNIDPIIEIAADDVNVLGNETALRRVFQNIIKNALAHGNDYLSIQLNVVASSVCIRFSNRFDAINKSIDVNQVFDRFYKADVSRTSKTTGLGLSIAKELVKRMDGQIKASVTDDIFTITVVMKSLRI